MGATIMQPFATVFIPHRYCMGMNTELIWLSVITDALVALSYYSIPAALFFLVFKRRESLAVQPILILFGLFIAFCGAGHAMDIVSLWKPIYWMKAWWNAGTALTSVITAIVLVPKVADVVRMPEKAARLEREKSEILERESLVRAVLDSIDEGIVLTDGKGVTLLFNAAAQQILEDGNGGDPPRVEWQGTAENTEEVIRLGNGKLVAHLTRMVPGYGRLYVLRDITERRASEEQRRRLERIIQTMKQGFCVISCEADSLVSTNNSFDAMYGYGPGELLGKPYSELLEGDPAERRAAMVEIREHALQEGFWEGETFNRRADGTSFVASARWNLHATSELKVFSLIQMDVTEATKLAEQSRKLQEKMLQTAKLESVGLLAGGIAHDFNNLLTGILGNASLVCDQIPVSSPLRPRLNDVIKASERAAELTRQLLAYSGKGRFLSERIELNQLIEEIRDLVSLSVPRRVEVRLNFGPALEVEADIGQMQQLFMNLVINGAEAIPEDRDGALTISTSLAPLDETTIQDLFPVDPPVPGTYAKVEVQDNGTGMDPVTMSQIFDPFFTTKFTGRGLGLAAAMGIVRGHGGAIKVNSEPGAGSVFAVYLPLKGSAESSNLSEYPSATTLHGRGTILIVDDEAPVRSAAQHTLEFYGYRVLLAENGRRAVEMFRQFASSISLVLLDLTMPVMSGEDAFRVIREIRADVPVVLSSGFNESEALKKFSGLRLNGFLQKPYTSSRLAEKVRSVLIGIAI